jgi:hypothetical protein
MIQSNINPAKNKATSTTVDAARGHAPMLANLVKFASRLPGRSNSSCGKFQKDQDAIVKFIGEHTEDWFFFIVTRPGLTREGPSRKRLAASKSVRDCDTLCTPRYAFVYV